MKSNPVGVQTSFGYGTKMGAVSTKDFQNTARSISKGDYQDTREKSGVKTLLKALGVVSVVAFLFFSPSIRDKVLKNGMPELGENANFLKKLQHNMAGALNFIADETISLKSYVRVEGENLKNKILGVFQRGK